jgi:lipopolysaccharide biosynthesis glycosyltransferase
MIVQLGLDDVFAMPGGAAIASVDRFLGTGDLIAVLHTGLSGENQRRLALCVQNASLEMIDCSGQLDRSWVPPGHVTSATYLRFLAAELLPDHDRALYLDGDVIVRRDISELWDTDLADVTLAAVQSRVAPFLASPGGVTHWFELGLRSTRPYFNAGVLLMNLRRWREERTTERLTEFLRRYNTEIAFGDQEAMNAVLSDDWTLLDRTWNYITHVTESFLQQPELEPASPHIVHFAGRTKPWSHGAKPMFTEEWYEHLERTPWAGHQPEPPAVPRGLKATGRRVARRGLSKVQAALRD